MKKQVLSVEQMQELIALGIDTSKASMCWNYNDENSYWALVINYTHSTYIEGEIVPTFTLQDILTCLEKIKPILSKDELCWFMEVHNLERDSLVYCEGCDSDSALETAFKVLKWCKQNNYI